MLITEFLQGRNVERQAVTRYINRHSALFEGHISKFGREIDFDDVAFEILDKQYPLAQPVVIVDGVPHEEYQALLKQSNADKEMIAQLLQQLNERDLMIGELKSDQRMLEYKQEEHDNQLKQRDEEIQRLKNRSLWDRIINK